MADIKYIKECKDLLCSWNRELCIVRMTIPPKLNDGLNVIPVKIVVLFVCLFVNTDRLILKIYSSAMA